MPHIDRGTERSTKSIRPTMAVSTTKSDDGDDQIPNHVLEALRGAGASSLFMRVIQTPASEVPGADRNSSRQEILKYMDWAEDTEKEVTDYLNYGGGFFQSLLNGDAGGADSNNEAILEYVRDGTTTGVQAL